MPVAVSGGERTVGHRHGSIARGLARTSSLAVMAVMVASYSAMAAAQSARAASFRLLYRLLVASSAATSLSKSTRTFSSEDCSSASCSARWQGCRQMCFWCGLTGQRARFHCQRFHWPLAKLTLLACPLSSRVNVVLRNSASTPMLSPALSPTDAISSRKRSVAAATSFTSTQRAARDAARLSRRWTDFSDALARRSKMRALRSSAVANASATSTRMRKRASVNVSTNAGDTAPASLPHASSSTPAMALPCWRSMALVRLTKGERVCQQTRPNFAAACETRGVEVIDVRQIT